MHCDLRDDPPSEGDTTKPRNIIFFPETLHGKIESLWDDAVTPLALAQRMIDTSCADDTGTETDLTSCGFGGGDGGVIVSWVGNEEPSPVVLVGTRHAYSPLLLYSPELRITFQMNNLPIRMKGAESIPSSKSFFGLGDSCLNSNCFELTNIIEK